MSKEKRRRQPQSPTKGDLSQKFFREIRNNEKPEGTGLDAKSIWRTRTYGALVALESKMDKKDTFCDTVQSILDTKAVVLQPETIKTKDLDFLANKKEVEEAIRRDCPYVDTLKFGVNKSTPDEKNWPLSLSRKITLSQFYIAVK